MSAPSEASADDAVVVREAAAWFAALRGEGASESERRAWASWRAADPRHDAAWQRVEQMDSRFSRLPAVAHGPAASRALQGLQRRRAVLRGVGAAGVTVGAGWLAARHAPVDAWMAAHRTGIGERHELALADTGGRLWLNTDSAVDLDGPAVRLHHGEICIDATARPRDPLRVLLPEGQVVATGARFTLRSDGGSSHLAVFDGRAEVRPVHAATRPVAANWQLPFDARGVGAPEPVDAAREAWTRGMLLAEDLPLGRFLAELARYHRGHLGWSEQVAGLRLVGAFPLGDVDPIFSALERTLPVRVRRRTGWWISIEPR